MPSLRAALSALAGLTVPGIRHNHDLDALPAYLDRAGLPALLVLPGDDTAYAGGTPRRLFAERGRAFEAIAFADGPRTVSYAITHLLLAARADEGLGLRDHLPALVTLVDAYFAALAADVTLGGALAEPARVGVEVGVFAYGGANYHGCALRHAWLIDMDGSA
ncbi:MAG: hypothetical protein SNJ59_04340 [Aggregatilineales bacterium]